MLNKKLIVKLILLLTSFSPYAIYLNGQTIIHPVSASKIKAPVEIPVTNYVPSDVKDVSETLDSLIVSYNLKIVNIGYTPDKVLIPAGTNKAFIMIRDKYKIFVIDLPSGEITDSIIFSSDIWIRDMILNKSGTKLYVATGILKPNGLNPWNTYIINTSTLEIINEIFPYATPEIPLVYVIVTTQLILSKDESTLYLVGGEDWIYIFDLINYRLKKVLTSDNTRFEKVKLGHNENRLVANTIFYQYTGNSPDRVLFINLETDSIFFLDPNLETYTFDVWAIPVASPDDRYFFTTATKNNKKGMIVIDAATGDIIKFIEGLTTGTDFLYNPDSTLAYTHEVELTQYGYTSFIASKRGILNLQSLEKTGSILGGGYSGTYSADRKRIFYAKYSPSTSGGIINFSGDTKLDLTVVNMEINKSYSIESYPEFTNSCTWRSIAVSDDNYVVSSNSIFESVSIFSEIAELPPPSPELYAPSNNSTGILRSLTFTWVKPQSAYNYYFQIADSDSFNSILFQDSSLENVSYSIKSLQGDKQYYWRVKAKNLIGWGEWSAPHVFRTVIAEPSKPQMVQPANNTISAPVTMQLTWQKIQSADSYELYLSENELFTGIVLSDTSITDSAWQTPLLKTSTKYYWKIRAKNSGGNSEFSDTWSFTTIVDKPLQVILNYPAENISITDDSVKCIWYSAAPSPDKYCFEISEDSTFSNPSIDSLLTDTTKILTGLKPDTHYWWKVKAKNAAGWGEYSENGSFNTLLTGIEFENQPLEYSLSQNYPNPFNPATQIKFSLKESGNISIAVYNMLGEKVTDLINEFRTAGNYRVEFKGDNIPSGIYLYVMRSANFSVTKKMILLR